MAVSGTQVRESYAGDDVTVAFNVPWLFHAADALTVILLDGVGAEVLQVIGTDYSVSGVSNPAGGTVTMVVPPPTGTTLFVLHSPALLQPLVLAPGAAIPVVAFEKQLDRITQQQQRTRDLVTRTPHLNDTDVDGTGAYNANTNRIENLADPIAGQDAATQAYVLSQTIVSAIPPAASLTNAMWDPAGKLSTNNVDGLTAFVMTSEDDPWDGAAVIPSVSLSNAFLKLQWQIRRMLNWMDGGTRTNAYIDAPAVDLPTYVASAIAASFVGSNGLPNGSQMVSQRNPSESASGTIGDGIDAFLVDRWFCLPIGGAVTWRRVTAGLHSTARSPIGIELEGLGAGTTAVRYGIRLGRAAVRRLGALKASHNVTFGVKVRHSGTTGSITPEFVVRTTTNTADDFANAKFAAGSMATAAGFPVAFPGPLTTGTEVAFTATFDLGAMVNGQNGIELFVDLKALNAATIKFTLTDFWIAEGDISSSLLPDDFHAELERVKPYFRKTFGYNTVPQQNGGFAGALVETGPSSTRPPAFEWRFEPPLRASSGAATTFNPGAAATTPRNDNGDDGTIGTARFLDSAWQQEFLAAGQKERAWYLHATVDAEWYD